MRGQLLTITGKSKSILSLNYETENLHEIKVIAKLYPNEI